MNKPKRSPEERLAKIRSGETKIVSAPQDKIKKLHYWIGQVLYALGHSEAYVTDESMVWDFIMKDKERAKEISDQLGIPIKSNDLIYEVAERLRDKENAAGVVDD